MKISCTYLHRTTIDKSMGGPIRRDLPIDAQILSVQPHSDGVGVWYEYYTAGPIELTPVDFWFVVTNEEYPFPPSSTRRDHWQYQATVVLGEALHLFVRRYS